MSKSDKTKSKSKLNVKTGKIDKTVFDRDLVTQDEPSSKSILMESGAYFQDTALRNFNGTVLGYVTPVNQFLHSLLYRHSFDLQTLLFLSHSSVEQPRL